MPSNDVPTPILSENRASPEGSATSPRLNTLEPPQVPFTPKENDKISQSPKEAADIRREITDVLGDSNVNLPTEVSIEIALRDRFSPERFSRAMNTLNQYGPQEGLRRLKSSDPEVAKQVERLLPKPQGED